MEYASLRTFSTIITLPALSACLLYLQEWWSHCTFILPSCVILPSTITITATASAPLVECSLYYHDTHSLLP